ncbi:MAG: hypothetical protein DRH70_05200 [Candidatus Coatesbacteria bacterium]|nr:MAG: hypothetical protein DRH70_05200 [Candidatus Coatesbacteria bacterium]
MNVTDTSSHGSSEVALQSGFGPQTETGTSKLGGKSGKRLTLDDLLRMPLEESGQYLRRAAEEVADEYINDQSVTEFTCLDSEDFVDDPEEG